MLELTRTHVHYKIQMPDHDESFVVVRMTVPKPEDHRRFFSRLILQTADAEGLGVVILQKENPHLEPFFSQHFDGMFSYAEGKGMGSLVEPGSVEEQLALILESGINIPQLIVTTSMGSAFRPELTEEEQAAEDGQAAEFSLTAFLTQTKLLKAEVQEFDPSVSEIVKHRIGISLKPATVKQRKDLRSGLNLYRDQKNKLNTVKEDALMVYDVFRARVRSAEGCVVNGAACEESNVGDWASLIPYPIVKEVMSQDSAGAQAVNPT